MQYTWSLIFYLRIYIFRFNNYHTSMRNTLTFLNGTPTFDCCVIRWGSKNKHHKNTCLKRSGLYLQILLTTPHSTMTTIEFK